jgi:hypothetical protein
MTDKIVEVAAKEMEKNKNLTEEQINSALDMTKKFMMPFMIGGIILGYGIFGAISSAIGAGIAKKNPNPTPFEQ